MVDRRRFPRIPKEVSVELAKLEYPLTSRGAQAGRSRDIAEEGVCCRVPGPFQPGTLVRLAVDLKGWQRHRRGVLSIVDEGAARAPLNAIAEVVWCQEITDGGFDIGLRFTDIYEGDRDALSRYIHSWMKYQ